jgi:hypothetical protein
MHHLHQLPVLAQQHKKDSRRGCGEGRTAQRRRRVRPPIRAAQAPREWAHMSAAIATTALVVAVDDNKAPPACPRTHRGWATTIHTARATTAGHLNEARLVDALACRADHACVEEPGVHSGAMGSIWAHWLGRPSLQAFGARCFGVHGIPLFKSCCLVRHCVLNSSYNVSPYVTRHPRTKTDLDLSGVCP